MYTDSGRIPLAILLLAATAIGYYKAGVWPLLKFYSWYDKSNEMFRKPKQQNAWMGQYANQLGNRELDRISIYLSSERAQLAKCDDIITTIPRSLLAELQG